MNTRDQILDAKGKAIEVGADAEYRIALADGRTIHGRGAVSRVEAYGLVQLSLEFPEPVLGPGGAILGELPTRAFLARPRAGEGTQAFVYQVEEILLLD